VIKAIIPATANASLSLGKRRLLQFRSDLSKTPILQRSAPVSHIADLTSIETGSNHLQTARQRQIAGKPVKQNTIFHANVRALLRNQRI
jgi:hypothetical protein